jgi:hypothetical protein
LHPLFWDVTKGSWLLVADVSGQLRTYLNSKGFKYTAAEASQLAQYRNTFGTKNSDSRCRSASNIIPVRKNDAFYFDISV